MFLEEEKTKKTTQNKCAQTKLMSIKRNIIFFMQRNIYKFAHTFEQPGVYAPGTANKTTFLLAHKSAIFTLFAGESSYRSTLGILSPTYKCQIILCLINHNEYKIIDYVIQLVVSMSKVLEKFE